MAIRSLLTLPLICICYLTLGWNCRAAQSLLPASAPSFKKVMVIIFENTSYQTTLNQPFFSSLTKTGALFSAFSAETHPSQPNYIALVGGDTLGVQDDSPVTLNQSHLGDLLEKKGKSWKIYAEDYPENCFLGKRSGPYARKHVPLISFSNVQKNPSRCARIVPASMLASDLSSTGLPDFSLYIPNLNNDGHDTGPAFADAWFAKAFGPKFQDPAFMQDLLVVVTFDEDDNTSKSNQIYTLFLGPNVVPGSVVQTPTNHYSILRLVEDTFGLGSLGRNDASATSIEGIWR
ncbi:alkaline phosphatase family protein [Bdellovibrionota bacterium FG-1]